MFTLVSLNECVKYAPQGDTRNNHRALPHSHTNTPDTRRISNTSPALAE